MADEQNVESGTQKVEERVKDETLVFDDWLKGQDENIQSMLEGHTKGLKSALESERGSRKDLEKQLREMAKASEKGSDLQTQLNSLADELQGADRKADFYEAAHAAGVRNLKLAFTVATSDEMFDKHGRVNFNEMKKAYPELFATNQPAPRGDAGNGTNSTKPKSGGMNTFIRNAAGRK